MKYPLDAVWTAVNSLGGTFAPTDEWARGYNDAIEEILNIIERLGGCDPLTRQIPEDGG